MLAWLSNATSQGSFTSLMQTLAVVTKFTSTAFWTFLVSRLDSARTRILSTSILLYLVCTSRALAPSSSPSNAKLLPTKCSKERTSAHFATSDW
eukprot:CAMPEP_0115192558 /NCGR_PEP_ID=MMETSP0270-20121206/13103_1 /TAXON_ID=71861 /ORGANISM="Scrippsiella trochoidea, Strain CCMP3099" /LENGTH=93 /DNA_ID=CAMNT_0002605805 /DNA_START=305 /DNA_END=583 /DNA_ORIENTATION=+